MGNLAEKLHIVPGLTAIIGGGGKTTLLYALGRELSQRGSVILSTSTHIWAPKDLPFAAQTGRVEGLLCLGTPLENGKITAPGQSFSELCALADFVLVEADGSKGLPIKAHASHEPVIPENAAQVICVVGASGLGKPAREAVHRPEIFREITQSELASPQAVSRLLEKEHFHSQVLINQADSRERLALARELGAALSCPVTIAALQKGEIIC